MGRPKALLPWRGTTMVEHVVGILRQAVEDVVVVSTPGLDLPPELEATARIVEDREPGLGPLGGIREGLEAAAGELAYVTSTDAPYLTPEFVETLLSFGGAAAPEVDGFVQAISAAYPTSRAATAAELIAEGRMRPLFLLESGGFRRVSPEELPDLDSFRNFNRPADYLEALREDGADGGVMVELLGLGRKRGGVDELSLPFGTLAEVRIALANALPTLELFPDGPSPYLLSLDGRQFISDSELPLGPGDRLILLDAAAGG